MMEEEVLPDLEQLPVAQKILHHSIVKAAEGGIEPLRDDMDSEHGRTSSRHPPDFTTPVKG